MDISLKCRQRPCPAPQPGTMGYAAGQEEFLGLCWVPHVILCSTHTPISYCLEKNLLDSGRLCAGERMVEARLGKQELYLRPRTVPGMG